MEELTPVTRQEKFLAAAAGSGTAPDPVTREEKFLKAIADNAGGGSSGGGVLVVNATKSGTTITCDTKASVMYAAFEAGTTIIIKRSDGYESVCIGSLHDEYGYMFDVPFPDYAAYRADTDDDYPVAHVE